MNDITGKVIGNIDVTVCKSEDGHKFFYLQANNKEILPVLDVIEDTLKMY